MKQLLISDGTTAAGAYTAGLLAPGAIDVVGLSADGHTPLVGGETIADYSAIRLIQGTAAGRANVVSPWIDGSSVSRWVGQSYDPQQAQTSTLTITGTSSAAFNATVKVTSRAIGQAQFERRSWTIAIPTGTAQNAIAGLINTQINAAALPGFLASVGVAANVITFTGQTFDSDPYRVLSSFETQTDIDATFTTDAAVAAGNTPDLGNGGDGNLIVELEASLQGMGRGYYDRVQLPVVPPAYAVAATTYDLYKLGFGNAAPGSIRGVDNYREIIIASPAGDADGAVFEGKINPWLNSCPGSFAAVQL
jgi:hypothetical protein